MLSAVRTILWLTISSSLPTAYAAGLDGSTVSLTGYCCSAPDASDAITTVATATVGPAVEFPSGSLTALSGFRITSESIDLSNTQIVLTSTGNFSLEGGTFNGVVYTFSGPSFSRISGASIDSASTFVPKALSFTDNSISVNVAGQSILAGQREIINVEAVPEPGSALMFLAGLCLVAGAVRTQFRNRPFSAEEN